MAKDLESTMRWKLDIKELKAGMQEAKRSISLANAEFKQATSGLSKWQTSTQGVEAKLKQLNSTLGAQKTVLNNLQQQYEITARELGETSPEAERLAIQIKNQEAAIGKTERQISEYNEQLNQMNQEQKESETEYSKLNQSIEEQEQQLQKLKTAYANAVLEYGKNSDEANKLAKEIEDLSGELQENKTKLKSAEDAADDFDKTLVDLDASTEKAKEGFTVMKGALANLVADGIRATINGMKELAQQTFEAGSNFESSMSKVEAISGATGEEMEQLTAKAKEMGEKTVFSASESADAFQYMAMAGWKTEDMINGIEGIMNLAAASGEDLATTSDIVTDALTAMGYAAGDAGQLADVMAAASSNANTNVGLMGATFQYAAPIIGALGYNMEDAAVAIGLMANAGIKGEKAGTALRSILTRLSAPPKECATEMEKLGISLTDSAGNMKSMDEVMQDLRTAFSKLSETEQTAAAKHIAGQEAMSGLLSIVRAAPADYKKLTDAATNSAGAAEKMSETMVDNVSGQITLLKSKIEGIMIKVFEKASGSIRKSIDNISGSLDKVDWGKFAESAGNALNKVVELFTWVVNNSDAVLGVLKAIATAFVTYQAVTIIQGVITAFGGLVTAIKGAETAMAAFSAVTSLNPVGLIVAALAAAVVGFIEYEKHVQNAIEAEYGLTDAQQENIDKVNDLSNAYADLVERRNESVNGITGEYDHLEDLKNEYNSLIDSNGKVKEGYEDRANFILTTLAEAMGMEVDDIQKLIDKNGQLGESIDKIIEKKKAEAMLNAYEEEYTAAIKNQTEAYSAWQQAVKDADDAHKKYKETKEQAKEVEETYNKLLESGSPAAALAYKLAHQDILDANEKAKESWEKEKKAVEDAEKTYDGYNTIIKNYEGLSAAIISGDGEKINTALLKLQNDFKTADNSTRETLENQLQTFKDTYKDMKQAVEDGMPGVTQAQVDELKTMVNLSEQELKTFDEKAEKAGQESMQKYTDALGAGAPDAELKAGEVVDATTKTLQLLEENAEKAGQDGTLHYADGIIDKMQEAGTAGEQVKDAAQKGMETDGEKEKKSGQDSGDAYKQGVESKTGDAKTAGTNVGKNADDGYKEGAKNSKTSGTNSGGDYVKGVDSKKDESKTAGTNVGSNAKSGMESVKTKSSGETAGGDYAKGVSGKQTESSTAGKNVGNKSKTGMESVKTDSSGKNAAQGFINGVGSLFKSVWDKGVALAKKFLSGVKAGGQEGSPWKTTIQSGKWAGEGLIIGIKSMMNPVSDAAMKVGQSAAQEIVKSVNKSNDALKKSARKTGNELQKQYISQANTKITELEKANKITQAQEVAFWKEIVKSTTKGTDAYSTAINKLDTVKVNVNDSLTKLASAYTTSFEKINSDLSKAVSTAQDTYWKEIENRAKSVFDTYKLFDKVDFGEEDTWLTKTDLINNLQDQVDAISEYDKTLENLHERIQKLGGYDAFEDAIENMGVGSLKSLQAIESMTDSELQQYMDLFEKKWDKSYQGIGQHTVQGLQKTLNDTIQQSVQDAYQNLTEVSNTWTQGLKDLGIDVGKVAFDTGGFIVDGMGDGITEAMEELNRQFVKQMETLVSNAKKALEISSPSKVFKREIGRWLPPGIAEGFVAAMPKAESKMKKSLLGSVDGLKDGLATSTMSLAGASNIGVPNYQAASSQVVNFYQTNNSPKALSRLDLYRETNSMLFSAKVGLKNV